LIRLSLQALAALALVLALTPVAKAQMSPKIVHGSNADITEFPFQVALVEAGTAPVDGQFCGGVITGPRTVLTAAHCLFDFTRVNQVSHPDDIEIFAGSADLNDTGATIKAVAKTTFDPQYDPATNDFDLGVITLTTDLWDTSGPAPLLDHTHNIAPISMMTDDTAFQAELDATPQTDAIVTGWGDTSPQPGSTPAPATDLQQATVPLVDSTTCQANYDGNALITARLFCAGNGPPPITDSCQGDSGGPIVTGTSPSFTLVGLVDSGEGCAQAGFPGIYDRLSSDAFQTFLATDRAQAPEQTTSTTMTGGNQPGDTLTCDAGQWDDPSATIEYQFVNTAGADLTLLGPTNTYTIQPSDLGTSIVCEPKVSNDGGYGFGRSSARFVPTPVTPTPPAPPPPPPGDTVAPRLTVLSKKCGKRSCTVTVRVRDAAPSSGIAKVKATLRYSRKVRCTSRKSRAAKTCTKRVRRTLRASAGKSGKFTIVVNHLKPGTGYSISLLPIDKAGNKPQFSTITSIRTKKLHPFFLF
jgi:secreted trypsin-like serine protease